MMLKAIAVVGAAALALAGCSASAEQATTSASSLAGTVAAPGFGDCEVTKDPSVTAITPIKEGVLTLGAPFPSSYGYTDNGDGLVTGGYLFCLGAEIANRAGLTSVELVSIPFTTLIAGTERNYDVSLWDLSVTPERSQVLDFATPYDIHTSGVMVRTGTSVTAESIATEKIGVLDGSIQQSTFVPAFPKASFTAYTTADEMYDGLRNGDINVVLIDTVIDMAEAAASNGEFEVIAQYDVGGDVAPALPKDSANTTPVSAIVEGIIADGTKAEIWRKWLIPTLGGDPADLPTWSAS